MLVLKVEGKNLLSAAGNGWKGCMDVRSGNPGCIAAGYASGCGVLYLSGKNECPFWKLLQGFQDRLWTAQALHNRYDSYREP